MSLRLKAVFILGFAALALYGRSLGYGFFIFDDAAHITGNKLLNPASWQAIAWFWTNSMMAVTYQAWWLIAWIFGTQSALPYHFFSIALHIANGLWVGALLLRLLPMLLPEEKTPPRALEIAALLGALFFIVHPVQVESVAWVSSTKDLLSSFFAFATLFSLLRLREKPLSEQPFLTMIPIYALVGLSFLAKPSGLALPLILIWTDLLIFRRGVRLLARDYGALAVIALLGLKDHQDIMMPVEQTTLDLPFLMRFSVAADVFVFDLAKVFAPLDCYFDYGKTSLSILRSFVTAPWIEWRDWLAAAFALLIVSFGTTRTRLRPAAYALGFFLFAIFPHTGFIPFVAQNISNTANRYLYFPLFAATLFLAWGGLKLREHKMTKLFAGAVLLVFFASSFVQVGIWQDSKTVLEYTLDKNPASYPSRIALAEVYETEGRKEDAARQRQLAEYLLSEEDKANRGGGEQ